MNNNIIHHVLYVRGYTDLVSIFQILSSFNKFEAGPKFMLFAVLSQFFTNTINLLRV